MKAMVLAAGRGGRLYPYTKDTPKPLLKIGEHRLIEYHLYALARAGIRDIVINVAFLSQQIMQALGDGSRYDVKIAYSQEPEGAPLGTGGGIYHALPLLGTEPFAVVSGDVWTKFDFQRFHAPLSGLAHLVLVDNPPEHPTGDFGLMGDQVCNRADPLLTYTGLGVFHPRLFADATGDIKHLFPFLERAAAAGQVSGEHFQGELVNLNTPADLENLRQRCGRVVI